MINNELYLSNCNILNQFKDKLFDIKNLNLSLILDITQNNTFLLTILYK